MLRSTSNPMSQTSSGASVSASLRAARPRRSRYTQVANTEESHHGSSSDPEDENDDVEAQQTKQQGQPPMATEIRLGPGQSATDIPVAAQTPETVDDSGDFVFVKTVDDQTYRVPVRAGGATMSLWAFRQCVERITGVPVTQQRLIHNGRILTTEESSFEVPKGGYVHLVVSQPRQRRDSDESSGDNSSTAELATFPETIVHRQMAHLHMLAWIVVVIFTLFAWRLLMALAFNDDPDQSPFELNLARLFLALFGVYTGWYGVSMVSSYRTATPQDIKRRVRIYVVLLTLLAMGYLISTLEAVNFDQNAFFGVLIIQSTFWYCILQAQMTHRALLYANPTPSATVPTVASTTTAPAPSVETSVQQPPQPPPAAHWSMAPAHTLASSTTVARAHQPDGSADVEMQRLPSAQSVTMDAEQARNLPVALVQPTSPPSSNDGGRRQVSI